MRHMGAPIFSDAHKAFMREAYLKRALQPSDVALALNKKFGTSVNSKQVGRFINDTGLSRRRKEIQAKVDERLAMSNSALATQLHAKIQDRFAERSAKACDKAFDFADRAHDSKTLASAVAAAKSAYSIFRLSSGIEDTGSGPRNSTFNFNFAAVKPIKDSDVVDVATQVATAAIDAAITAPETAGEDEGDDEAA